MQEDLQRERRIIFLVAAVQFINILDFMMVAPMGPNFSHALGFPASNIGWIGGAYTAAAAISGLLGAFFLDRFDRRQALAWAMLGLVVGTAAGGWAFDLWSLIAARCLAGFFGGPATALALSIVADAVPATRRGQAMGAVMGAFSAASVLGVPLGLELARLISWRAPFYGVAGLGLFIVGGAIFLMPPMRDHLHKNQKHTTWRDLLHLVSTPQAQFSLLAMALSMMGFFALTPNISTYLQYNVGYPAESISFLYLLGGVCSFFSMRWCGRLVDKHGSPVVSVAGTVGLLAVVTLSFAFDRIVIPGPILVIVPLCFIFFMITNSMRNVAANTLASKVPPPDERARYQSLQSFTQHLASSAGAFVSALLLSETALPDGSKHINGIPMVALFCMILLAIMPFLLYRVERLLKQP